MQSRFALLHTRDGFFSGRFSLRVLRAMQDFEIMVDNNKKQYVVGCIKVGPN